MPYTAPVNDLVFAAELAGLDAVARLPGFEDATPALLRSILEEAGRFAAEVLAPLNHSGDRQGARLQGGEVITADGWKDAYRQFVAGGWNGLPFDPAFGGQGLPWLAATAVAEIWHAANMAFSLCPLLTQSAIAAIEAHGTDAQRETYLPKLVSGEWSGTMNLTEPQAGSDLSAVRTRAVPVSGGEHYRITGQKIFITYGDHDMTANIIHLVLARLPDAPPGVKGISLFIVPKFLAGEAGDWTRRNDIETVSLEHKLGIHASPTAVLGYGGGKYGDGDGALGYLVGEANRGLQYMFTMMNLARHAVGVEGNGVAERAYQQSAAFAAERVQGRAIDAGAGDSSAADSSAAAADSSAAADGRVAIIRHADVKRMLLAQKCRIEALRALSLTVAANIDHAHRQPAAEAQSQARDMLGILTPVIKGHATECGVDNVSLALQVHGGMGFIEETGAAQHYRDVRITPIYEGTTGIQALDLVGRKLVGDGGGAALRVIARIRAECEAIAAGDGDAPPRHPRSLLSGGGGDGDTFTVTDLRAMADATCAALDQLQAAAESLLAAAADDANLPAAVAEPYLRLWGTVACGWQMLKAAALSHQRLTRGDGDAPGGDDDAGDGDGDGDAPLRHPRSPLSGGGDGGDGDDGGGDDGDGDGDGNGIGCAFYRHKIHTARFYFAAEMPKARQLADTIRACAALITEADPAMFEPA